jgi:predicted nuclease of predicted toxin-antitoxin system
MKIFRRIILFLLESYPDSTQVALIGLEQTSDYVIRQYAIDNGYVIVTQAADFYEMSLLHGQPPKIIWLKTDNQSNSAAIKTLRDNRQAIAQALIAEDKACIEIV